MKNLSLLLGILLISLSGFAQDTTRFQKKLWIEGTDTLRYRILYPSEYKTGKKYPVVLFLHGSGERGRDNEKQLVHGATLFANDTVRKRFPAIVIFPQCPDDSGWARVKSAMDTVTKMRTFSFPRSETPTTPVRLVKNLLDDLQQKKVADPKRMYIGGLSMGGFGTFDMIARYPDYFAAAFPICGGGDTSNAAKFAGKIPTWIFHGGADPAVNPQLSRDYYAALQNHHATVKYTEYPGVGHNSWDNVFAEPGLLPWVFSVKKK